MAETRNRTGTAWTAVYLGRSIYISHPLLAACDSYSVLRRGRGRTRPIIDIRINDILAIQGRTFYWLAKQTGISHTTLWRLKKGKALGMNLDTLEKMCHALNCVPGDILVLSKNKKNRIAAKPAKSAKKR